MVDRKKNPSSYSNSTFYIKQAETFHLESGNPVHVLVSGTQPIIRLEFIFPAGVWFETQNGLSYLASKMLVEGTKSKSSKDIADHIALYGAFLETNQSYEHLNVTVS